MLKLYALTFVLMIGSVAVSLAQDAPDVTAPPAATLDFPCQAKAANMPQAFRGFWIPQPSNDPAKRPHLTVTMKPQEQIAFDCVGEPLAVTVANGQIVDLIADYPTSCTMSVTVTKATADSPISDILGILVKVGALGLGKAAAIPYYQLPPLKDKVLTITVTCNTSASSSQPAHKLIQSVVITYQNPPRVAVSAGVLVSTSKLNSFGIKTTQTGVGAGGIITTQNSVAVTGSSSAQFIPFSFVNIYWAGSRTTNLNAQLGLGVNPNLSTPRVEWFVSPLALGWHDVFLSAGFHFGQHESLTDGFSVGELTPSSVSKAPISWRYYTGFGISLSYNLKPLAKSTASAAGK